MPKNCIGDEPLFPALPQLQKGFPGVEQGDAQQDAAQDVREPVYAGEEPPGHDEGQHHGEDHGQHQLPKMTQESMVWELGKEASRPSPSGMRMGR